MARGDGWQDRTDLSRDRVRFTTQKLWGDSHLNVGFQWLRDTNFFGSPLPVEGGLVLPGFEADRNYAVGGARIDHHALNLYGTFETPVSKGVTLSTTLGGSQDRQGIIRSFILSAEGDTAEARGQALEPEEKTAYLDAHLATDVQAGGRHRLVGGVGVTWGETRGQARDFEFDLQVTPEPIVPDYADLPTEEERRFEDMRRFLGVYVNDEWTPTPRLTVTAGLRYDSTSEELEIEPLEEEGGQEEEELEARDKASDSKITGGVAALYRIVEPRAGTLTGLNVYGGWRTNFKPAAPNVAEPEGADILDPETTDTWEAGVKTTWFDRSATLNVTYFDMDFQNMVVGILTPDGPRLVNAGEQRFQGVEVELGWMSPWMEGLSFYGGYAYHDARFVEFSFVTPDGELRVVDGKRLELAPRDMWNVKAVWAPASGFGGFVAVRHQNQRPLTRRNTAYTPSFFETDAGISYEQSRFRIAVVGRNLGDSRHYVAESEIGDSQFYVAPPLGVSAELTVRF
jgi:outer membrane receptor protein involved in Fe transport